MCSALNTGRRSPLHLPVGQAVSRLFLHFVLQKSNGVPRVGGLRPSSAWWEVAPPSTPGGAEATLSRPSPQGQQRGNCQCTHTLARGYSPPGSEALIRRQDCSRACSTYLLTSCFLGAVPNKAANKPARKVQPLAESGPQERN